MIIRREDEFCSKTDDRIFRIVSRHFGDFKAEYIESDELCGYSDNWNPVILTAHEVESITGIKKSHIVLECDN